MIRATSVLGPRLWSGLHVRSAYANEGFPHSAKAGRFDEADSRVHVSLEGTGSGNLD